MKKRKRILKITSVVLLFCMALSMASTSTTYAASMDSYCPIQTYPLVERAKTYDLHTGRECGYAAKIDLCKILDIFDADEIIIEYPLDSGGTKIARAKSRDFFIDNDLSSLSLVNIGKNLTVYREKECLKIFGETYSEDSVLITGVDYAKGVTQILYPITGTGSWKMGIVRGIYDPDSGFTKADIEEGYYIIQSSTNPDFCADIYGGWTDNGTNLQLYSKQYSLNQVYLILKYKDGYVIFCYHADGKVWDVEMSTANVLQWQFHGEDNQIWDIFTTPSGEICFKNRGNGKYLDVSGNIMADEINIATYEFNNTSAQKYILQPVTINGQAYTGDIHLEGNSSENSVNQKAQEVVNKALEFVGVSDYKGDNAVVFNYWFYGRRIQGSGYPWCMAFLAYIGNECGVSIPKTASCSNAIQYYCEKNLFHYSGSYIPKPGDLVFYGKGGSEHVGIIVDYCKDGYLQVVEGNVRDDATGHYKVTLFTHNNRRTLNSSYVYGYATPDYR